MVLTFGEEPDPAKRIRIAQGKRIRACRKAQGYSQAQFAQLVGVSLQAVSGWERGIATPRPHHQVAIAEACNTPWSNLFALDKI